MSGVAAARASGGLNLSSPWHPPTWGPLHLPPPHGLVEGKKETPHLYTRLDAVYVCILTKIHMKLKQVLFSLELLPHVGIKKFGSCEKK